MNRLKSSLGFFVATLLVVSVLAQSVSAITFTFGVNNFDLFLAIDYEGNGTITHMNAGSPTQIHRGPTSLQDLNIIEASDLRIEVVGNPSAQLSIGQPGAPGQLPNTVASYQVPPFSPSSLVIVSQVGNRIIYALNPAAATALQTQIDLYGPDDLFLALSLGGGGFFGASAFLTVSSARQEIDVDIKPDANPNSINPNSRGVIAVAVLTTASFDASTVDVESVSFGVSGNGDAPLRSALRDVDGDGDDDLILHFKAQGTGIECGISTLYLKGDTLSGQPIGGPDGVLTVGCR